MREQRMLSVCNHRRNFRLHYKRLVCLDIDDVKEILRNVGTVYFGAGTAKSAAAVLLKSLKSAEISLTQKKSS